MGFLGELVGTLEGVKVVDFTRLLPGPFGSGLLAELGAEVTKLELPHWPDPIRTTGGNGLDKELNGKKRFLALDPRKPADKEKFHALVRGADVFLEGSRPGLVKKLGMDWESLRALRPELVYVSIPGFGPEDPLRRVAAHDLNFQALAGLLGETAPPRLPAVPVADLAAGLYLALAVAASLRAAQRTGEGRRVEVPMRDAAHSLLVLSRAERLDAGKTPEPGSRWWNGSHPFYAVYETKDGRYVSVAALEKNYSRQLLKALEREDLEPLAEDPEKNADALCKELAKVFAEGTLKEWTERLSRLEVCVQPVLTPEEALAG